MKNDPIFVTRPFLPELDELLPSLREIWDNRVLTNGGPFHQRFEKALAEYLGVEHLSLFNNGTIALITALQALEITGEVVTSPFSFVATGHALLWRGLTPVFADIDPNTFNLDPAAVERALTGQTRAILPVHCYGRPCDLDGLARVADRHGLKLIYDAAHTFGVRVRGRGLASFGDLSVLSLHATKVFNTFEGGAIISPNAEMKAKIDRLKNFGFAGETTVEVAGLNGKMNEFSAALGLTQLKHVERVLRARGEIDRQYRERLTGVPGLSCHGWPEGTAANYAYFPILVDDTIFPLSRDELYEKLKNEGVYTRRYFYPLISEFSMYAGLPSAWPDNLPVATEVSRRVLCLPIYPELELKTVDIICALIVSTPHAGVAQVKQERRLSAQADCLP